MSNGKRTWNETMFFNPLVLGWDYVHSNCCEANFIKGDLKMKIKKRRDRIYFTQGENEILAYCLPKTQLEFYILQKRIDDGINT